MDELDSDIEKFITEDLAKANAPPEEVVPEKIRFFDPHFHLFDSRPDGPSDNKLWDWLYPSANNF